MKKIILLFFIVFALQSFASKNSFAIVVDKISYEKAKSEIDTYKKAVENQGLNVFLVVDKWQKPDSIRMILKKYFDKENLEGCVLIGDIPVVMVRDAQHMASAFKMDQESPWHKSSIPSDRFYDDFNLKFDFIKQDTAKKRSSYFYYSLRPDSPQKIDCDIYSARIKVPETINKYDVLKNYLKKIVKAKEEKNIIDNVFYFAGHGYNSECMIARIDEKQALLQQFPYIFENNKEIRFFDFSFKEFVKFDLLKELKRPELDIALLHNHGGPRAQYLSGLPNVSDAPKSIENIKNYLRSKVRDAKKSKDTVQAKFKASFAITDKWFDGVNDPKSIQEDSIYNSKLDVNIEDLDNYSSNAKFIMFDACFNGSFHLPKYQSGAYVFGNGKTIAGQANSVNTIQDKWPDEMIGLLGFGARIGSWHKEVAYIETHLIGDPTYSFASTNNTNQDINEVIIQKRNDVNYWEELLKSNHPDLQCLALRMIYKNKGNSISNSLFETYKTSKFWLVRMECLVLLSKIMDDNFYKTINLSVNDSYELIRRFSNIFICKNSSPQFASLVAKGIIEGESKRVSYYLNDAVSIFDYNVFSNAFKQELSNNESVLEKDSLSKKYLTFALTSYKSDTASIHTIANKKLKDKERMIEIRSLRNKVFTHDMQKLFYVLNDKDDKDNIKLAIIEALGWYNYSYKKAEILVWLRQYKPTNQKLIDEVVKTINRLQ